MTTPKIDKPKVFISYAWTSDAYVNKVAAFASSLMAVGIDVLFDKFELKPGHELNDFMERSVKDPSVTNVLILLNKRYKDKADNREGGVGKETQILSEELYNNVSQTKIIPIVFDKGANGEIYKPVYLGSTYFINLAEENKYNSEFQLLVKSIYGETVFRKPELGRAPNWVTEEISFEPKVSLQYSSLKTQSNVAVNEQNFISYLNDLKTKITQYDTTGIDRSDAKAFYAKYLDRYKGLTSIRNEYLELLKHSIYVEKSDKKIASFFEATFNALSKITVENNELLSIFVHELFIYTIAYLLKYGRYTSIGYILGKSYYLGNYNNELSSFSSFYCTSQTLLDNAMKDRDNKSYYTGVGAFWIENINNDFCSSEEFTLADILCFNYVVFSEPTELSMRWFPITYIYGNHRLSGLNVMKSFADKLKSVEFLNDILPLFNYNKKEAFISHYASVEEDVKNGKWSNFCYNGAFDSAPLLCHYTKSTDIGKYR